MLRRDLLLSTAAMAAVPAARADTFPNGPFRIIVPFGAGSATDQAARNVADGLNRQFAVPAVVENKPGANGAIAAEVAAKSKPDGQTIFVCSNTAAASNVALMKSLPYDPLTDFDPMTIIVASIRPRPRTKSFVPWGACPLAESIRFSPLEVSSKSLPQRIKTRGRYANP